MKKISLISTLKKTFKAKKATVKKKSSKQITKIKKVKVAVKQKKTKINLKQKKTKNKKKIVKPNIKSKITKIDKKENPETNKIAIIFDKKVPSKLRKKIIVQLKNYDLLNLNIQTSEKAKSIKTTNLILEKLLNKNFNRSDLIIGIGGGIIGDMIGFVSSIYKRGINFISIPTTLLSQVDAAVGGKTGVNSKFGKNLVGTFSQPKLVISDIIFLKSLPRKEIVCGYAEILKHAIINDKKFFDWLKSNTKFIFTQDSDKLIYAITKSCKIKLSFVNRDVNEKNIRMTLNFGHTFAHAIEVKNNYSKNFTHGEAVLAGMIIATKLSIVKKICNPNTLKDILKIYELNNLNYILKKYSKLNEIKKLIPFLKNDKKNNDEKVNFVLLRKIGKTTKPNSCKISTIELKKNINSFTQY